MFETKEAPEEDEEADDEGLAAGSPRVSRSSADCVASTRCPPANQTSDGLSFSFSACSTPTVCSISPNQGSYHQLIHIQGQGFSDVTCANEVSRVMGVYSRKLSSLDGAALDYFRNQWNNRLFDD